MAKHNSTVTQTGQKMMMLSRRSSPSTKRRKAGTRAIFGTSSQFKGIGRGKRGDPRK